ncbi:MAG: thioredoxin domain-containing protein [Bacteroidota bacterium]|nr:thioredoxin domain-containing protein [Bacteroidota bacterium]
MAKTPNRLIAEKSPYLLQHAYNPVDWFPWGEEAFAKARRGDKPIFLSIGYSTCHWCHVMEHESFENEETAALMNEHFVCIKVDREERPDVDRVYMAAVQTMTGSGGWPLSVFLTPDLKPFYGGTYFPPNDAYGKPGFAALLKRIAEVYRQEKDKVVESGNQLIAYLQQSGEVKRSGELSDALLKKTYHQCAAGYDERFAGFGSGPKFPRPVVLNFLFRYFARTKEQEALRMAQSTLHAMASGGMYDHIGGGFHRYSVDGQWRVPHFEKMLYDQAQLVCSYLDAFQITHDDFYADVARETIEYVLRDLSDVRGGFYSAEDADSAVPENPSQKSEGAFYLWRKGEVVQLLGNEKEAEVFCRYFGIEQSGNALADSHGEFAGKNILYQPFAVKDVAARFSLSETQVVEIVTKGKRILLDARARRPRPHCDDKILTSWNSLTISALARASQILDEQRYTDAAVRAAEFIVSTMYAPKTKTLLHRYRDGDARFDAHLDDYAFMIQAALDLYEATFDTRWLSLAFDLHGTQIALFWDSAEGGFFDTSGKDKSILFRQKEEYDGAEPSGNSIAAMNMIRLSRLSDDEVLRAKAETTLKHFAAILEQTPQVMPHMIAAISFFLTPPQHIIIAGRKNAEDTKKFLRAIHQRFIPGKILLVVDSEEQKFISEKLSFVKEMKPMDGKAAAYVCENYVCNLPTNDVKVFEELLGLQNS